MKKLWLILFLILFSTSTYAALTVGKIPVIKNGGSSPTVQDSDITDVNNNVGIGTVGPSSKLEVNGNASIGYQNGITAPANGLFVAGNMGIGTYLVSHPLDIRSTASGTVVPLQILAPNASYVQTAMGIDATHFGTMQWNEASSGDVQGLQFQTSSNTYPFIFGNYYMFVSGSAANGNVGIGTFTPVNKLDIKGAATVGFTSPTTAPANSLIVNGNIGIGTSTPPDKLYSVGNVNATTGYKVGNASGLTATCGGTAVSSITITGGIITACSGT